MIEISSITDVMDHIYGLKAVVFDMDDTLYSEKDYIKSGYHKIADSIKEINFEELWDAFENNKPAIDYVLAEKGIISEELKIRCLSIYREQMPDIHTYSGVHEMLGRLRSMGLKLGIITDGRPDGQWNKISALGIKDYFHKIIITDELGGIEYRKPNPISFEMMQKALGVEFTEMCYVGDNIKKDFIAPEMLGMRSIRVINKDGIHA